MPQSKFEAVSTDAAGTGLFVPLGAMQNSLRAWWFIFLLMALGGLFGWLAHRAQPPVYEAVAHFSATIDYVTTGPLTQYEEDVAFESVGDLLLSRRVLQKVVEQAADQGFPTSVQEILAISVLERRLNTWDLRVRGTDRVEAEKIANLWVDEGERVLQESYRQALLAEQLHRYLLSLETCLARSAASEPASAMCSRYRFADIQADLKVSGAAYAEARKASLGLFSGMILGPVEHAQVSDGPVLYNRSQLVLAGSFAGLLLGVWLAQFNIPTRWMKRR